MHFICCMTPQPNVKILKLLQVQTSIHSFFVLQDVTKSKKWLIDCWKSGSICKISNFGTNFQNTNNHHLKVLIMLRKLLLIPCQRQKYHVLVLSVSLSNLTSKNFRQTSQWYPLFTLSLNVY